ncbi:hypothetical protein MY11210_008237 [Beauveria gryllotalpidicola]
MNRSLVFYVAKCISFIAHKPDPLPSQDESSPLIDLLRYLLINRAPASDYDSFGQTPLSAMFGPARYIHISDPLPAASAELLLRSNTEGDVACLSCPGPVLYTSIRKQSGEFFQTQSPGIKLFFLACSAEIAEAYGCGPLSLAILSNNLEKVELLVRKHPTTLAERNVFGHTPLHLAADKPSCLRLLVKAADTILFNQADTQDESGQSVVETAIALSSLRCREDSRICQGCGCDESANMLLEADCELPVSKNLNRVLMYASERCKLTYARHMKDRRDRLKQLALENLPIAEVERLGLASERVLDSHASQVTQLLQDSGIAVPAALAVVRSESLPVYRALTSPEDAEIFFCVGFRDTDAWCTLNTGERYQLSCFKFDSHAGLRYLHWLIKHGGISYQPSDAPARDIFAAHLTFWLIGFELASSDFDSAIYYSPGTLHRLYRTEHTITSKSSPLPPLENRIAFIHELHTAILPANIADACHCQCSPKGCTPVTVLLRELIKHRNFVCNPRHSPDSVTDDKNPLRWLIAGFIVYLENFWCHLEVRHHITALRFMTYTALGMPHSCCTRTCYQISEDGSSIDEDELQDEQVSNLELLEELLDEFEGELIAILQDPDRKITNLTGFWERTWLGRMTEVLDRLEGSDLSDAERRAAEEIGLVWDKPRPEPRPEPPEAMENPHCPATLDYWMYELEKIEAECQ